MGRFFYASDVDLKQDSLSEKVTKGHERSQKVKFNVRKGHKRSRKVTKSHAHCPKRSQKGQVHCPKRSQNADLHGSVWAASPNDHDL